ncbi:MAG TPA: hypothetical protein VGS41_17845, partial [Chthonomonadales bacterium]|nr:hypothetical protein [Chthonomonadales bacterium]
MGPAVRLLRRTVSPGVVEESDRSSRVKLQIDDRLVTICRSGLGAERSQAAASGLLALTDPPIDSLLICGFCAGLNKEMAPGDLVVCTDAAAYSPELPGKLDPYPADAKLVNAALLMELPGCTVFSGSVVSVASPVEGVEA